MTIRDAANNPLTVGFTGQVYTVSAPVDNGMYRPQFPITDAATNTSGGRGGTIYRINTLADNVNSPVAVGDGSFRCSLRRALQIETGPRNVVFEISGFINNNDSPLNITSGNVTIAGQTAPSPGITWGNEGLQIQADNVVVQHIASRPGNWAGTPVLPQTSRRDGILVYSALNPAFNVILDHCSISWAPGKNLNLFNHPFGRTLTWRCLDSEALYRAANVIVDPGQPSSMGALTMNSGAFNQDIIQCVFASNSDRNPEVHTGSRLNWLNNIIFNWGRDDTAYPWAMLLYSPEAVALTLVNSVSNRYVSGPSANTAFFPLYAMYAYSLWPGSQIYFTGNVMDTVVYPITEFGFNPDIGFNPEVLLPAIPLPTGYVPLNALTMSSTVFANVGSRPLDRSPIDSRVITSVVNRNGAVIQDQSSVGGYGTIAVNNRVWTVPSNPFGISPRRGSPFTILEDAFEDYCALLEPAQ